MLDSHATLLIRMKLPLVDTLLHFLVSYLGHLQHVFTSAELSFASRHSL